MLTVVRGLVSASDLSLGEGTFTRKSASGANETLNQINASIIPLLIATALKSKTGQSTVDGAIAEIYEYLGIGPPEAQVLIGVGCQITSPFEAEYVASSFQEWNLYQLTTQLTSLVNAIGLPTLSAAIAGYSIRANSSGNAWEAVKAADDAEAVIAAQMFR